jgi:hypothetical protein
VEIATNMGHTLGRLDDGSVFECPFGAFFWANVPDLSDAEVFAQVDASLYGSAALIQPAPACGSVSYYCNAAPTSVSQQGARLRVLGCPSLTANDLVLQVAGVPAGTVGLFAYGSAHAYVPLGGGWMCLGGTIQRVLPAVVSSSGDTLDLPVDLTQPPFTGGPNSILPGSGWGFQCWFRDAAGSLEQSDAAHIDFAP